MTRLEAIKNRCQKATKGPWRACRELVLKDIGTGCIKVAGTTGTLAPFDADFIAHSITDIPLLLAVVEAAKKLDAISENPLHYTETDNDNAWDTLKSTLDVLSHPESSLDSAQRSLELADRRIAAMSKTWGLNEGADGFDNRDLVEKADKEYWESGKLYEADLATRPPRQTDSKGEP